MSDTAAGHAPAPSTTGGQVRLGVDVGGTFTDLVLVDAEGRRSLIEKVLTTPGDPSLAILSAVRRLRARGIDPGAIGEVIHGTTLVGNAIITRGGARVGLVTTRGFRDVLQFVGRELKYDIYDPNIAFPRPIVPRRLAREVGERIGGDGRVVEPLDDQQARTVVRSLIDEGVESLCISLLHAYLNPVHERRLVEIIREEAPDMPVSASHEVLPEIREYDRTSTTALNAYVQPVTHAYLDRLAAGLREEGITGELFLMTSSGGMIQPATARELPIQLIESGPAAGALFAARIGAEAGLPDLISFDMGGTTAKLCVVQGGRPVITKSHETGRVKRFHKGSGLPVGVSMVDLLEIGAGGGSIAEINELGLLQVGPRSAGSEPGPVCYGRGGDEPTVTDANLVLGFLNPDYFLGGEMRLDVERTASVIEERIGRPLGLDVYGAAMAINSVVTDNMAEAARVHSVEMNVDIRRLPMVAFGGAGPIHAYGIAQRLGSPALILPPAGGVLSAVGLLAAPLAFEFSRSLPAELDGLDPAIVRDVVADLKRKGSDLLGTAGVEQVKFEVSVDVCYVGQGSEVKTPLGDGALDGDDLRLVKLAFDDAYEAAYGRRLADLSAKSLTWRVLASGPQPGRVIAWDHDAAGEARKGERDVFFPELGRMPCAVYERGLLSAGAHLTGPALVEERVSTLVVPPNAHAVVDERMNVIVSLGAVRAGAAEGRVTATSPETAPNPGAR